MIIPSSESGRGQGSGRKKTIILLVLVALVILVAAVFGIVWSKKSGKGTEGQTDIQSPEKTLEEKIDQNTSINTEVIGRVVGMQIPNDGKIIFLDIEANLVDKESLAENNFSSGSAEIKTIKKKFNIAVDDSTVLNVPSKSDINLGDFVIAKAPSDVNVYEMERFTAIDVNVAPKVQPENQPENTAPMNDSKPVEGNVQK